MKFEYDWSKYQDGRLGLVFVPPRTSAFEGSGLAGSGHDWESLLCHFLPRVAPAALEGTEFDSESDLFVAINRNPLALKEMVAVIESLLKDSSSLKAVVRSMPGGT